MRSLTEEDIVRLILDGTVIKTRLDRKATNISLLAAIGVRRDGHKVLLSIRNMGGESAAQAARVRDHRVKARVSRDGAPGLEAALVSLRAMTCRSSAARFTSTRTSCACPKRLHDELTEDYITFNLAQRSGLDGNGLAGR
ncbi:hypothetical protein LCGC14_1732560 [marine sediment metagenome]|uniref:Uncharacterized protein n=1 Tax=marine sediment metagenome TaxID=412755 RepID=A0A0F9H938_9ZZZZ